MKLPQKLINELKGKEIILNIGSGKQGKSLTGKFIRIDIDKETRPDVVASIYSLPFPDNYADAIICTSLLEHLETPQEGINEMYRVLKECGIIIGFVPFIFPYHASTYGQDYYRFTKDGVYYLFRKFKDIEIEKIGYIYTIANLMPLKKLFKRTARVIEKVTNINANITAGYFIKVTK